MEKRERKTIREWLAGFQIKAAHDPMGYMDKVTFLSGQTVPTREDGSWWSFCGNSMPLYRFLLPASDEGAKYVSVNHIALVIHRTDDNEIRLALSLVG